MRALFLSLGVLGLVSALALLPISISGKVTHEFKKLDLTPRTSSHCTMHDE